MNATIIFWEGTAMNIGIVVFSQTGHTLSVAERLAKALKAKGHDATIARVEPVETKPNSSAPIKLKSAPDVGAFDAVIFASPVQGFTLARAMQTYLSGVSNLAGKKVSCFVTQHLKKAWMGGNRSLRKMRAACQAKGADVTASGIVHWSSDDRESQIEELIRKLSAI
jgi:flavodoxin